jgi:cysteine-rich repeat protein
VACTLDTLLGAGGCSARCEHAPIVTFVDGDGCCPDGGAYFQDQDCPSVCGNGHLEPGEQCDDGNHRPGDGCSPDCQVEMTAQPTAFRIDSLVLQDPHVFPTLIVCLGDQTAALNAIVHNRLDGDTTPMDGFLDLSPVLVFDPLQTQPERTSTLDVVFASCTAPAETSTCDGSAGVRSAGTVRNRAGGSCVDGAQIVATTTAAYGRDDIDRPSAPCFMGGADALILDIGGSLIELHDGRVAGVLVQNGIMTGLLSGFISQTAADRTLIQLPPPISTSVTLGSLLAGDPACCWTDVNMDGVVDHDDRDLGPDGVTRGWYFYFNFTAVEVPYTQ